MSKKFLKKTRTQTAAATARKMMPGVTHANAPQARTRSHHNQWKSLALDDLSLDGGTQSRVQFDVEALDDYAARMIKEPMSGLVLDHEGEPWPALVVFDDGERKWLADGFHRARAARKAGLTHFQVDVKRGELRDAIRLSLSVNAKHGLRRSNDDKRRAVERALQDDEWVNYSDRKLAQLCAVSAPTVAKIRRSLEQLGDIDQTTERVGADGRTQDTSTRQPEVLPERRIRPVKGTKTPDHVGAVRHVRLDQMTLLDAPGLSGALDVAPLQAAKLDSIKRADQRALILVSTHDRAEVHAVCDHLDKLMGKTGGTAIFAMLSMVDLPGVLERLNKRRGHTTQLVVFEQSQSVALVHTQREDLEIPVWSPGLGALLTIFEDVPMHMIQSSRTP